MSATIRTQPNPPDTAAPVGGFTLVLSAGCLAESTVFVMPNYNADGSPLAWVSRWLGMDHYQSKYFSPALAARVVANALRGLDFSR